MTAALLSQLAATGLLAKTEGGGSILVLLVGPVGGGIFYAAFHNYYRNASKSHSFERETRVTAKPITGSEAKAGETKGTKKSKIEGANHSGHRTRVQRVP